MTDIERINAERNELNTLIGRGVKYDIDRIIKKRQPGIAGFFKKKVTKSEKLIYTIQEPTLATLDRVSAEQIELRIDEKVMASEQGVSVAKQMVAEHSKRLARIVAILTLGNDHTDTKKLNELTEILFTNVKPSKLIQLVVLVNSMSNLGDFINSIRLMSASRTTMPILIEEESKQD